MEQFVVPQFIDVEDKIIGPFTIRQFVYLAGGGGLSFIIYTYVPFIVALPIIAGVVALSLALAFSSSLLAPPIQASNSYLAIVSNKLTVCKAFLLAFLPFCSITLPWSIDY